MPAGQESALYLIAFLIGGLAGAADVLSRYRDEPFAAATTRYGLLYIALNGGIAFLVYAGFGFETTADGSSPAFADNVYLNAIVTGSGAMLILRSKLFTIRSEGGKDIAFGPAVIVDAVLAALDRGIDRSRASARHKRVFDSLNGVDDFDGTVAYFQMSLLSFQNLTQQEKADLVAVIDEYKEVERWSPALKTMAIGFAILTLAGEDNFDQFVRGLKTYLEAGASPSGEAARGPGHGPDNPQP